MKKVLKMALGILFTLLIFPAASCGKLDVVGNDSVRAFGELLQNAPQLVSEDTTNGGWSFAAPDNSVRFIWSENCVMLEIDAAPFIAAGLDPAKLPGELSYQAGKLTVEAKWGNETLRSNGDSAPLDSYKQIVKLKRSVIGYHGAMDHYGINIGDGNVFEWAKDLKTNDKDIVFVLDPAPFINAGVKPDNIAGWLFTKVPVDDANGRMVEVDKILKPFDLL